MHWTCTELYGGTRAHSGGETFAAGGINQHHRAERRLNREMSLLLAPADWWQKCIAQIQLVSVPGAVGQDFSWSANTDTQQAVRFNVCIYVLVCTLKRFSACPPWVGYILRTYWDQSVGDIRIRIDKNHVTPPARTRIDAQPARCEPCPQGRMTVRFDWLCAK